MNPDVDYECETCGFPIPLQVGDGQYEVAIRGADWQTWTGGADLAFHRTLVDHVSALGWDIEGWTVPEQSERICDLLERLDLYEDGILA
jgi:hypothetical protein